MRLRVKSTSSPKIASFPHFELIHSENLAFLLTHIFEALTLWLFNNLLRFADYPIT